MSGTFPSLLRLILKILLVTLVIGAAVFSLGWLAGWRTAVEFSNACFVVGGLFIALGTLSVMGGFKLRGDWLINFAQSAGPLTQFERTTQNVDNSLGIYSTLVLLTVCGLILMFASFVIDRIF
jgi:hypothetical protein